MFEETYRNMIKAKKRYREELEYCRYEAIIIASMIVFPMLLAYVRFGPDYVIENELLRFLATIATLGTIGALLMIFAILSYLILISIPPIRKRLIRLYDLYLIEYRTLRKIMRRKEEEES